MKIKVINKFFVQYEKTGIKVPYEVGKEYEVSKKLFEEIKYYVEVINTTKKDKNNKVEF